MTRAHRRQQLVSVALAACLACVPRAAHADEKISPEARAYFKNGVELLQGDAPNYQDAYYQFKLAYEQSKSWKVLGNYGLCALKLERDGEAIAFYEEYLKRGGKSINKDEREAIERDLLLVKGNAATLELMSSVAEFTIQDARSGSSVPAQSYTGTGGQLSLTIRAGQHHVLATASDGRSVTWDFSVEPAQVIKHELDFETHPAAPVEAAPKADLPPVAPMAPDAPSEPNTTLRTAGFVTAGVGVLALGSGIVTGLMAKNKASSAKSQCSADRVCDESLRSEFDHADQLAHVTNYLLIGGGVVTAVGVGMIALGWPGSTHPAESARSIRVLPLISPSQGGLWAEGRF